MKFDIQSRKNMLISNILFEADDPIPNFGSTIEEFSNFMKFGTKSKWNILIYPFCMDFGQILF